ncbi:MAG: hypothetical protein ACRDK4_13145 [Solirubrobacteraceae bacterium]
MTSTVPRELDELKQFEELIEQWSEQLLEALSHTPLPTDYLARWQHTASRLSDAINSSAPPSLDPEQVAEIRGELLEIMRRVADSDPDRPLDSIESALLGLEAIRHIVRDALDQQALGESDARTLLQNLQESLPRINRKDLARLVGISDRSIQRILAAPKPVEPARRMLVVARLVSSLRRGWTPEGILAWFERSRPELDGRDVLDSLDDASVERDIFGLARHGRAQHGS